MAIALEAIPLLGIVMFAVLWCLAVTTRWWLQPFLGALHDALGWVPYLGDLVKSADAAVIGALNDAIAGLEQGMTTMWAGVVWSWNQFLKENELFAHTVWHTLDHAFTVAIPTAFNSLAAWTTRELHTLRSEIAVVRADVLTDLALAERYAADEAAHALAQAIGYADSVGDSTLALAKTYTSDAVQALGVAEDSAIAKVTQLVQAAEADAQAAAALAVGDLAKAEAFATAYADTIGKQAWKGIDDLTATLGKDFNDLVGKLGIGGAAALIASIPLIATLVNTIAAESGLDNAACRSKVKGICGTDPAKWLGLLEGIAAIGVGFSLADIVEHATTAVGDARGLISEASNLSADTVKSVGTVIGQVAAGIAG